VFRFTIRELVLLTLVVAMGVGWWVDRSSLVEQVSEATADARTLSKLTNPGTRIRGARWFTLAEMRAKYGIEPQEAIAPVKTASPLP
jgi:hypothetical protein